MKYIFLFCLCILCSAVRSETQTDSISHPNDFCLFMNRIRQDIAEDVSDTTVCRLLHLYHTDSGSFTDIDYASDRRTFWPPLTHLNRLTTLVQAYTNRENRYYANDTLYQAIEQGLLYWHEQNPQCNNWWYNQIAEPQAMGKILIQMRIAPRLLPRDLETLLLDRMRSDGGNPTKWTGANRTDIALHWIYRACLEENEQDLSFAVDNVYRPVIYTTGEGFQHDNSNLQHGHQLYIGGYGDEILKGVTQVAMYAHGTQYAMSGEKIALLSKFMRETYYATIRGQFMSFGVAGRSISRPDVLNKSHTVIFARRMLTLDPKHKDEFLAIIARLEGKEKPRYAITPTHNHYFRADYTLHQRPSYLFDVRLASTRTCRLEYGNNENLKTYFASDGCTNITLTGDEYFNIFPVWNWTRIPGVTAPQLTDIPLAEHEWQQPGTSNFAGGVSDSLYGITAYAYQDSHEQIQTSARKSWFFYDNEVVCLGAGITSTSTAEVWTTLNQCLSDKDWKVERNGNRWVSHRGITYLFPKGGNIYLSKQKQEGNWYDINRSHAKEQLQKDVFTLALNHGLHPVNATYAYIVAPGMDNRQAIERYRRKHDIKIVSNTASCQIVYHTRKDLWGLVFYEAGTFKQGRLEVSVDKPCIMMIRNKTEGIDIHIADPAQTQSAIKVKLTLPSTGKQQSHSFIADWTQSGIYAGSTKAFTLKY